MWSNQFQQISKIANKNRRKKHRKLCQGELTSKFQLLPMNGFFSAYTPRHHKFKTTTFQDRHTCIRHQVQDINTSGKPGFLCVDLGVSKNRGTSKSSILIGFSIINHPFWGTPIFGNTHLFASCFLLRKCSCPTGFSRKMFKSIYSSFRGGNV